MIGFERDCIGQAGSPALERLAGNPVDEVQADVVEPRSSSGGECGAALGSGVTAGQCPELIIPERLDAERQPVDARRSQATQSGASRALGFASRLTSAGTSPQRSATAATRRPTLDAGRSEGVPPPK